MILSPYTVQVVLRAMGIRFITRWIISVITKISWWNLLIVKKQKLIYFKNEKLKNVFPMCVQKTRAPVAPNGVARYAQVSRSVAETYGLQRALAIVCSNYSFCAGALRKCVRLQGFAIAQIWETMHCLRLCNSLFINIPPCFLLYGKCMI